MMTETSAAPSSSGPSPSSSSPSSSSGDVRRAPLTLHPVNAAHINAAWRAGVRDFTRAPLIGLFFGAVYALGGVGMLAAAAVYDMGWIVYPALAGFALIGPFAAVGLYEVSRRLEAGETPGWSGVVNVIWAQRKREIAWMGFVMIFLLVVWMYQVRMLLALFLGFEAFHGIDGLVRTIFTTPTGLAFLAVGHAVGALLALAVFCLTVISIPLLLDRDDVDFVTAMVTSIKVVKENPGPMFAWGLFVVIALFISAIPAFLGLLVSLPMLGHATWHIYRRAVEPKAA